MASGRRAFLQQVMAGAGAAAQKTGNPPGQSSAATSSQILSAAGHPSITYPRVFRGRQLALISFPWAVWAPEREVPPCVA